MFFSSLPNTLTVFLQQRSARGVQPAARLVVRRRLPRELRGAPRAQQKMQVSTVE